MAAVKTTALLVLLGFSGLVHAAPGERPHYQPDGKVRVGSQLFQTANEYVNSDAFRASGARCGSHVEAPSDAMNLISPNDCSMAGTVINPDYNDARVFVIQVVYHIIKRTDGVGDITPALLRSQIDVLNEDFNALAGTPGAPGTNMKIQFALARFDPQGNPHPGYNVVTNDAYFADPGSGLSPMKDALNWDTTRYLNVYTNDANGALGYATFPAQNAGTEQDGVVMLWNSVGRNSPIGAPYNLGRTMTHEVGHYLGLYHTFQGGCGTAGAPYTTGDRIMDTPAESSPNDDCTPKAGCIAGQMAPIENYMDYSRDICMNKFTVEQTNRARCSMVNYRTINTRPTAMFTSTATDLTATFTNNSIDTESQATLKYNWTFGDGTTSTDKNPMKTYAMAGTYNVSLEVVDPGSGHHTVTMPVTVTAPPPMTPDAGTTGPDGGGGNNGGGDDDGGGCCESKRGAASHALLALPVFLALRRRRRRA
jgi:hypothetical protein